MKVDVLVIGSGVSGTGAALAAARSGAKVVVVRRGFGATAMASGAVSSGPSDTGRAAAGLLADVLPFEPLGGRQELLSSLGGAVEADLAFTTQARGTLDKLRGKQLAVIGFEGMVEVRPQPIVRVARRLGVDADAVLLPFPEAKHTKGLTTPELARLCDDIGPAEKLAAALAKQCEGYDAIALPPVLGLLAWEQVAAIFDDVLGERWFELVAATPSVPGLRIQQALDAALFDAGVLIVHGPVLAWAGHDDTVTAVKAGLAEGEQVIEAKQVVLATGGLIGHGLVVDGAEIREALFGLHVQLPTPADPATPAQLEAGIATDPQLRPLDGAGALSFSNLRAAGELTGATFGSGRGGLAVSFGAGWAAGELAAGDLDAELGEVGQWHEVDAEGDPQGCLNCGVCLSRCPTVRALAREKQAYPGPRGMMAGLTRFETELDEVADELSLCTLCGACSVVCPGCVEVPERMTRARQILGRIAPEAGPAAYQSLRGAFDTPKRLFPADPIEGPTKAQAEAVLFIGCSLPYYEREHAAWTMKLLEALGVDFTLIDEVCCGGPLEVIGATGTAAMAEHNVAELRRVGAKRIITCCPRCAETMTTTAAYADFEVEHTTSLLARLLPGTKVAAQLREKVGGERVTFHDPCERARLAGEIEAARTVMSTVGLDLVELPRSGTFTDCCGAGGGVRAAQTRTSVRIARLRVLDAVNTGAPTLLTECPSCLHNLYNGRKRKQKIEISNLSSYLGAQLD